MDALKSLIFVLLAVGAVRGYMGQKQHPPSKNGAAEAVTKFRPSYADRLFKDLFSNYNKHVRPCANTRCTNATRVQFGVALIAAELKPSEHVLALQAWLRLVWTDPRLAWDPEDYGGRDALRVPQGKIWRPDITLYNKALLKGNTDHDWDRSNLAILYHTGAVLVVPTSNLQVHCVFNDSAEHQECNIKFGSWTYDGYKLDPREYEGQGCDLSDFVGVVNQEWELESCTARRNEVFYPCCPEPYPNISINVKFRRRR